MKRSMYSSLSQVKPEYMVSELPYICESVVANLSRTTWGKPWTRWLSVRRRFYFMKPYSPQWFYQAGNYGSGKRGGGVSALICAVLDDRNATQTDEEPKYAIEIFLFERSNFPRGIAHLSA
jgi:hypothetical protein